MSLIVQKFGGTSVADAEKIVAAAQRAIRARQAGNQVIVVVSAMGKNTDVLVDLAHQINSSPPAREMDMLLSTGEQTSVALMAMAIDALGFEVISMTGFQLGIETDSMHTVREFRTIRTERIEQALANGKIVIAAGFQGIDKDNNITTLGRGGSDTTAVALAARLRGSCHIHTDVAGVFTTDPRLVPTARKMKRISYDEMLELASLGAGVMHSRSIEFAKKFNVPIHVSSSFSDAPGTDIAAEPESPTQPVTGAALVRDEARVTILGVPDRPGVSDTIFTEIAGDNIPVDMVVQNQGARGKADLSFTVLRQDLNRTLMIMQRVCDEVKAERVTFDDEVAKVSVVGLGMADQPGVANRVFRVLAVANINIIMITTSRIKISVLVERRHHRAALWAVHQDFQLDKAPAQRTLPSAAAPRARETASDPDEIAHELQMVINENLTIETVTRDDSQALLTISHVPDQPGLAADVFDAIAANDILVDMIVQDAGVGGQVNLSFTVPRDSLKKARQLAVDLTQQMPSGSVSESAEINILSVFGIGLRSHTSVAIRMFAAFAEQGINVRLINTSEVCVSVIVDEKDGPAAEACLRKASSGDT